MIEKLMTLAVLLAAALTLDSGITYAATSNTAAATYVAVPPHLADLDGQLCPSGAHSHTIAAGDAQAWSCGPWTAVSAPEAPANGRPAGWTITYSGTVKRGQAEPIDVVKAECQGDSAVVINQSPNHIECSVVRGGQEEEISYITSTDDKAHMLFGMNLFETQQDRITVTVKTRPVTGAPF
jgi:hypothetical protein